MILDTLREILPEGAFYAKTSVAKPGFARIRPMNPGTVGFKNQLFLAFFAACGSYELLLKCRQIKPIPGVWGKGERYGKTGSAGYDSAV